MHIVHDLLQIKRGVAQHSPCERLKPENWPAAVSYIEMHAQWSVSVRLHEQIKIK